MSFNDGPGSALVYGYGLYGQNTYGQTSTLSPVVPGITGIYSVQPGYCPSYLRFQFSGIALPLYIFDINPSTYTPYPQRTTQQYQTILSFNPTVDETYKKIEIDMSWDYMTEAMWQSIYPYTRKNVDGTSEPLLFWDGTIGHYKESLVKIESFKGEVRAGYAPVDRFSVSLKLREV